MDDLTQAIRAAMIFSCCLGYSISAVLYEVVHKKGRYKAWVGLFTGMIIFSIFALGVVWYIIKRLPIQ